MVADNGKNSFVPVKIDPDNDENFLFLVYQSALESTGVGLIQYVPDFRKAKNPLVRDWGQTSIGARNFIFINFCIQKKIAVRSASVRWVTPRPEI